MEYKELSNGFRIPVIGLGTWEIGGRFEADTSNEKRDIDIIRKAIELGYSHIDTGEIYGNGQTEKEVGMAIKGFEKERLFITTKVWKTNLHYDDVIKALEGSLRRLQTDYVDLYLVHWPNPDVPVKETMEAMEYLAEEGKIKAIGVSNFSVSDIKQAQKHLKKHKIVANQIKYNLLDRAEGKKMIPFCVKNDIMMIAYRPLAKGKVFGIKQLGLAARKYNKTASQIALNWVISHKNVVAVSKSMNIEHLRENLEAVNFRLKPGDIKKLEGPC